MTENTSLTIRRYEHVEPLERGSRYEDPLEAALSRDGLGAIAGGGSLVSEEGEIEYAEIEVDTTDENLAITRMIEVLEAAGAPQGSVISRGNTVLRSFGRLQCLAVYLDGLTLPDEVYADLDFDAVVAQLGEQGWPRQLSRILAGRQRNRTVLFWARRRGHLHARRATTSEDANRPERSCGDPPWQS